MGAARLLSPESGPHLKYTVDRTEGRDAINLQRADLISPVTWFVVKFTIVNY